MERSTSVKRSASRLRARSPPRAAFEPRCVQSKTSSMSTTNRALKLPLGTKLPDSFSSPIPVIERLATPITRSSTPARGRAPQRSTSPSRSRSTTSRATETTRTPSRATSRSSRSSSASRQSTNISRELRLQPPMEFLAIAFLDVFTGLQSSGSTVHVEKDATARSTACLRDQIRHKVLHKLDEVLQRESNMQPYSEILALETEVHGKTSKDIRIPSIYDIKPLEHGVYQRIPLRGLIYAPSDAERFHEAVPQLDELEELDYRTRSSLLNNTVKSGSYLDTAEPSPRSNHSLALRSVSGCTGKLLAVNTELCLDVGGDACEILYPAGTVAVICNAMGSPLASLCSAAQQADKAETPLKNPLFSSVHNRRASIQAYKGVQSLSERHYVQHTSRITAMASHLRIPVAASAQLPSTSDGLNTASIHIWDVRNMQQVCRPIVLGSGCGVVVTHLEFSSCGRFLCCLSAGFDEISDMQQWLLVWDITLLPSDLDPQDSKRGGAPVLKVCISDIASFHDDLVKSLVLLPCETKEKSSTWTAARLLLQGTHASVIISVLASLTFADTDELLTIERTLGVSSALYQRKSATRPTQLHYTVQDPFCFLEGAVPSIATVSVFCALTEDVTLCGTAQGSLFRMLSSNMQRVYKSDSRSEIVALSPHTDEEVVHVAVLHASGLLALCEYHRHSDAFRVIAEMEHPMFMSRNTPASLHLVVNPQCAYVFVGLCGGLCRVEFSREADAPTATDCELFAAPTAPVAAMLCHPVLSYNIRLSEDGEVAVTSHQVNNLLFAGVLFKQTVMHHRKYSCMAVSPLGDILIMAYRETANHRGVEDGCVHFDIIKFEVGVCDEQPTQAIANMVKNDSVRLIKCGTIACVQRSAHATVVCFAPVDQDAEINVRRVGRAREWTHTVAVGYDDGSVDLLGISEEDAFVITGRRLRSMKPSLGPRIEASKPGSVGTAVRSIDWDVTARYLQVSFASYEMVFWDTSIGAQVRHPSLLRDTSWHTFSSLFGWPVMGIWNESMADIALANGPHRAAYSLNMENVLVTRNVTGSDVIVTGTAGKKLKVYSYPALSETCQAFQCCGWKICSLQFSHNDAYLYVADRSGCVFQYKFVWSEAVAERIASINNDLAEDFSHSRTLHVPVPKSVCALYVHHSHTLQLASSFAHFERSSEALQALDMNVLSPIPTTPLRPSSFRLSSAEPSIVPSDSLQIPQEERENPASLAPVEETTSQNNSLSPDVLLADSDIVGLNDVEDDAPSVHDYERRSVLKRTTSDDSIAQQFVASGFAKPRSRFFSAKKRSKTPAPRD